MSLARAAPTIPGAFSTDKRAHGEPAEVVRGAREPLWPESLWQLLCGARIPPGTTMPGVLKVVGMTFSHDEYMPLATQKRVYETFLSLPAEDRDFVRMYRDEHGDPSVEADHAEGGNEPDPGEYFGVWKVSTALMTCVIDGTWCEYALGDTPEQRSMGTWSDGVPVTELVVVDDPVGVTS